MLYRCAKSQAARIVEGVKLDGSGFIDFDASHKPLDLISKQKELPYSLRQLGDLKSRDQLSVISGQQGRAPLFSLTTVD